MHCSAAGVIYNSIETGLEDKGVKTLNFSKWFRKVDYKRMVDTLDDMGFVKATN